MRYLGFTLIQWLILPLLVLLAGTYWQLTVPTAEPTAEPEDFVRGWNNTALFVVNDHAGFSNVHLATAQSLLERYPEIQVHFSSFARLAPKCQQVSVGAYSRQPAARNIEFHPLEGPTYMQATRSGSNNLVLGSTNGDGLFASVIPAGLKGIDKLCTQMQILLDPWTPEDHFSIYKQILSVIDEVDPAVVVLDTLFFPGVEAARTRNRVHAIISPNLASDTFGSAQPRLGMLWKYPALGSGYPFPVPFTSILPNIYLNIRIIGAVLRLAYFSSKRRYLKAQGIQNAMDLTTTYRPDVPWITQTLPAAAFPLDIIPLNVTLAGPILLSTATARTQDPELMTWVDRHPTILINLGTLFTYSITQAHQMAAAIEIVLREITDIQILWKFTPSSNVRYRISPQTSFSHLESTGRVKVVEWLTIDPAALLVDDNIIAVVTHGGAGGYHEAIASGVPQVLVPLWADLYNFAQLAESKGVGVWACREKSPDWDAKCLAEAILDVIVDKRAREVRRKAEEMRKECEMWGVGRDVAGDVVAGLARSGW